jgi:hypothetical protein
VLLSNPVYIGEIGHKGARYPGQHEAILDRETWDNVQDQLRAGAPEQRGRATGPRSPLIGKLFDEAGHRLTPSHATKAGRRYRYYVSRPLVTGTTEQAPGGWRIPASQLENLIATEAATMPSQGRLRLCWKQPAWNQRRCQPRWRWRIAFATISGAMLRAGKRSRRSSIASSSAQSACA